MKFLPTPLAYILLAACVAIALVLAIFAPQLAGWMPICALGFILVIVLDGAICGTLENGRMTANPYSYLGEDLNIAITLDQIGAMAKKGEVVIFANPNMVDGGRVRGTLSFADQIAQVTLTLKAQRRGEIHADTIWWRVTGVLGLCWRYGEVQCAEPLLTVVQPNIAELRSSAIAYLLRDSVYGLVSRQFRGQGYEFEALNKFQHGMERRAIDWKASARHGTLMAREFEIERNNHIVFALDCGQAMCEPLEGIARIDRAVKAALITSYISMNAGDRVQLYSFAGKPVQATGFLSGRDKFHLLQRAAGHMDYHFQASNYTLALSTLDARLTRRAMIVIFTEFTDPTSAELLLKSVARLIGKHLLLFVVFEDSELEELANAPPIDDQDIAKAVTASSLLAERERVIAHLRHLGIDVISAKHDQVDTQLINHYLAAKKRGVI